jgi:hypothetical protein
MSGSLSSTLDPEAKGAVRRCLDGWPGRWMAFVPLGVRDSQSPTEGNTIRGSGRGEGELCSILDDVVSLPLRQTRSLAVVAAATGGLGIVVCRRTSKTISDGANKKQCRGGQNYDWFR